MSGLSGRVLITGSGTLARAILRQARREGWQATFTIFARSESRLAALRLAYPGIRTIIGDVRDAAPVAAAVAGHDLVIHTAALKRIPECAQQPDECTLTNVVGSALVAQACTAHGVPAVAISTDKACRASTAYGHSKGLTEALFLAAGLTCVRYGNVADSTGSVIPLWREQARKGKPLTITDRRMTRFWMSPTDAVQLIVHAASHPGGVWVPKMGAFGIDELAERLHPGALRTEIGLRSAEKLHEDLVASDEPATETLAHYRLHPEGQLGHSYSSATCRRLTVDEVRAMLADAEGL